MKTYMAKKGDVKREWFVADAEGKVLGRLATRVATVLSGKHKVTFTPHVDAGDYVVVTNADKIRITGRKGFQKVYRRYSGYPGGLKETNFETLLQKKPREVVKLAVKNMLPKNKLGRRMIMKLKLYTSAEKPALPKNAKEIKV